MGGRRDFAHGNEVVSTVGTRSSSCVVPARIFGIIAKIGDGISIECAILGFYGASK